MFWLSILSSSSAFNGLSPRVRTVDILKKIWQFCHAYGEYQSLPPSQRRRFIMEREIDQMAKPCPGPCD